MRERVQSMIYSMTAFARGEQNVPEGTLVCEIRSVNHRYLDTSFKLPDPLKEIEVPLREAMRARLGRGKVDCTIRLNLEAGAPAKLSINTALAKELKGLLVDLSSLVDAEISLNAIDLLKWPGLVASDEVAEGTLQEPATTLVMGTLDQLVQMRLREGEEIKLLLLSRLDEIDRCVCIIREQVPGLLENHRAQLLARLDQLHQEPDPARLEQELVYLLQKADVEEELDRLNTHVGEVRRVLEQGGTVGRRLDFLMQELNREANTLSSKAIAASTSLQSVDLKVLIEQMREQIQNIE